ncbi:ABC transporter permease [Paraflavitalea sp. CAU 1676]|uniref:ABC transporter permease n=1 Tax=Paraflavitalea sp. CAU 1676 TaxID=3032598 RepID=UPI0023D9DC20|nr:ABC transporter permease [Paraflavitalea sp. CAU 1676]MDF2189612.1 ABC transporter permease [Paraflavitalea sp. CAU 1676]
MQEQDRIWTLICRQLAGEATVHEVEELNRMLQEDPELTFTMDMLLNYWQQRKVEDAEDSVQAFDRLKQKLDAIESGISNGNRPVALNPQQQPANQHVSRPPAIPIAHRITWKKKTSRTRKLFATLATSSGAINNYVKSSCRTLLRNRAFSAINIIGLAVGMAGAMLLLFWILNIFTFDNFHTKRERIYQVYSRETQSGQTAVWGSTPHPVGPALKDGWPQVEEAVRMNWVGAFVLKYGDKQLQTMGFLTDPGFLNVFDFPLLAGDRQTALQNKHSIVLTEETAARLFGDEPAVGKVIKIDSNVNFTVTAVVKNPPGNSSIDFDYLVPWSYMKDLKWENSEWGSSSITTCVLLKPGVTESAANKMLANVIKQHDPKVKTEVFLHPMRKWQLWSRFDNGKIVGGGIEIVRLMGIIAAFILLIACINYMNMSTARSEKRAKEVGIRKVAGAARISLVFQFISESTVIALIAGVAGLMIAQLALPWFNTLTGQQFVIPFSNIGFWLAALGFVVVTGVLAGSYPAFYLSAFRPVKVLKGTFRLAHAMVTPRKVLVVVQFTFAIIFIICTTIIYRQILHIQKRDIGIDLDKLAFVYVKGDMSKNYELIKHELLTKGLAKSVTRTNSPITDIWSNTDRYSWEGKGADQHVNFIQFLADQDFTHTMNLKVVAGRDLDLKQYPTDSTGMLLTELAVKRMGLKQPVGAIIKDEQFTWHVVGVVRDFIPGSPAQPISPIVLQGPNKDWFGAISFRLADENKNTIESVEKIFRKYNPEYPFEMRMASREHTEKFRGERNTGELATVFAGLTILISCLGLFALATYMAESRIREIGVRKVLGASVSALVALLSTGFLKLVFIAFLVASPIAWWMMHNWLGNFAYRIEVGWWVFGMTGLISVLIAVCTVTYQALKAATASPVKALRNE